PVSATAAMQQIHNRKFLIGCNIGWQNYAVGHVALQGSAVEGDVLHPNFRREARMIGRRWRFLMARHRRKEEKNEECEAKPHTPITPTNSFTASALFCNAACSSAVSLI